MAERNRYNWNAEDYSKHSTAQLSWARELITKLNLKGDESLLDIGCGDGKVTAEIAASLPNGTVTGIDSSKEMIELAKSKFPSQDYPNLNFAIMDAVELNFQNEFDIVFSNAALHWVKNHETVLSGINNSLKPGGRILLQMGGKGNADAILSTLDILQEKEQWKKFFNDFKFPYFFPSIDQYNSLLQKAGLLPIRVELIPKKMNYENTAGLAGWIRTTWLPYTEKVPEDLREDFINEVIEQYVSKYLNGNKINVSVDMIRLEIEAAKENK